MRRGELTRICWEHVDVKTGRLLFSLTKSGKPTVLIADTAVDMLLVERTISRRG
jgi:integrase